MSADYLLGITDTRQQVMENYHPDEDMKSGLEAYKKFKGSAAENDFALMCKRWNINYSKVPDKEKMVVMRFLRKSKNYQKHFL